MSTSNSVSVTLQGVIEPPKTKELFDLVSRQLSRAVEWSYVNPDTGESLPTPEVQKILGEIGSLGAQLTLLVTDEFAEAVDEEFKKQMVDAIATTIASGLPLVVALTKFFIHIANSRHE